jgi:membrane-associated protease RseP (regulator of RpoE activity)
MPHPPRIPQRGRRVLAAILAALVVVAASGCSVRFAPELLPPGPAMGPTTVTPNAPVYACSDGRIGVNVNEALEITGFPSISPARDIGLRVGDIIRIVNGVPMQSVDQARIATSGPPGSIVNVTVLRFSENRTIVFGVRRACI